jgi:ABC-type phosphate transport system permease subunit
MGINIAMEFIFKFGEHYYGAEETSFFTSLIITLIGTAIGFFLALFANRLVEKRSLNNKLKCKSETLPADRK